MDLVHQLVNKGKARLVELDEIVGEVEDLDEPMLEERATSKNGIKAPRQGVLFQREEMKEGQRPISRFVYGSYIGKHYAFMSRIIKDNELYL